VIRTIGATGLALLALTLSACGPAQGPERGGAETLRGWTASYAVYGRSGDLAVVARDPDFRLRAVVVRDGRIVARTPEGVDAYNIGWFPEGDAVLVVAVDPKTDESVLLRLEASGRTSRVHLDRKLWLENPPTVAPDGRSAVMSAATSAEEPRTFDLFKVDLATGHTTRLHGDAVLDEGAPAYVSEDRLLLTLAYDVGDERRVVLASLDLRTGHVTRLTDPRIVVGPPSVDPVRGVAVFTAYEAANAAKRGLYGVRLDRPGARLLFETRSNRPSLAPTGDRVVVTSVGGSAGIGAIEELPVDLAPLLRD
jgi:hypothetical protein